MVSMIYMVLATAMFFLQDTYFLVAGMELSLKNPCALAILFLALLNFIVTVRLDRLMVLIRHTAVQVLPYLIPLVFSAVIWVSTKAGGAAVMNGVSMIFPQMLSVLVAFWRKGNLVLFGGYVRCKFHKYTGCGLYRRILGIPTGTLYPSGHFQQRDWSADDAAGDS